MFGVIACGPAWAQCVSPPTIVATNPAEAPYVARYTALAARDPYDKREDMAPDWRTFLDDLRRDPAVSPALLARSENRFAAALGQGDAVKEALPVARHALTLAESNGLATTPIHAEILTQLALAEIDAAKIADAILHSEAAVAEAKAAVGPRSWATGRAAMAANAAYVSAGRYLDAEPFGAMAEDLAIACLPPDDPRIITRISSHAAVLGMVGRLDEGLAGNERAANWAATHGHAHEYGMVSALNNLGWDLRNSGRLQEAEGVLRYAVDVAAQYLPENWQMRAQVLGKLADVLQLRGHSREAEALWLEASAYDAKVNTLNNPLIGSGELRRAASAAEARDDLPLALTRREQAVALIAKNAPADHPELARARIEYAATLSLAGRHAEAQTLADPAMAVVRAKMTPTNFLRMTTEMAYAQIVAGAESAAAAYPIATPVARRMETVMLDAATSRGDLVRYTPLFTTGFATATHLALATGREDEAFRTLQLANFSDLALVNADIAARAAAGNEEARAAILRLQRQVLSRQQIDRDRIRAGSSGDPAPIVRLDTALHNADAGIAATTRDLDRIYPAFRRIGRPEPVSLDAFRSRLGDRDILIAPLSLADEIITVAVRRAGLVWASAPISQAKIREMVGRIRASIDASRSGKGSAFDADAARRLYTAILPKALAATLQRHRHILYYASGLLAKIPPAILIAAPLRRRAAPAWLIRSHSISILPTLDPPHRVEGSGQAFLGIGAPRLSGMPPHIYQRGAVRTPLDFGAAPVTLPALPKAASELRGMAAAFPAGDRHLLLFSNATERAVKTLPLTRYRVLAIATHGLVRDALPGLTEPALVLTPPKTPDPIDDGLLTASEIANLNLRAEWVILSACDTASGSNPDDATYSGLARAFIEAGAHALLVSHWAVRDDAAERLTTATVRAARHGMDRATALQRAMLTLMRDRSVPGSANPAIWAPFVLVE